MVAPLLVAGFLVAHALIHASYLSPRPPATAGGPEWPFELGRSWLLSGLGTTVIAARVIGITLIALTIVGFAIAASAAVGIAPASLWRPGVAIGALASVATLLLFFHPWLVLGLAIDLVLLWGVVVARWSPPGLSL